MKQYHTAETQSHNPTPPQQGSESLRLQPIEVHINSVSLSIDGQNILDNITLSLPATGVTTLIGPSGAGKSSLLRCITLLHKNWLGEISVHGQNIRHWPGSDDNLRRHIGLIAQKPCVFPTSIIKNVVFGLSRKERRNSDTLVETCLKQVALWDEVSTRLNSSATKLSLGQQQRLCLARALAIKPKLLLLDEPTASLDPRSKQLIEQTMLELSANMPILCITHDLEQAKRLGGTTVFMCDGQIIEQNACESFFNQPTRVESREFLRWSVCDC